MKKRISLRHIVGRRSYNTVELARTLQVHPQTIRSWHDDGLLPIDESEHYPLYLGSEVRRYYQARVEARKVKLAEGEAYCLKCKGGREVVDAKLTDTKRLIGHGKKSYMHYGKCKVCGTDVCRFGNSPTKLLVEGEGTNIDGLSPLNRSYVSRKELYDQNSRNPAEK